jgi:hypothetical protein
MSKKFSPAVGTSTDQKSHKPGYHKSTSTMDNLVTPPVRKSSVKKAVRDVKNDQKRETWLGNQGNE